MKRVRFRFVSGNLNWINYLQADIATIDRLLRRISFIVLTAYHQSHNQCLLVSILSQTTIQRSFVPQDDKEEGSLISITPNVEDS